MSRTSSDGRPPSAARFRRAFAVLVTSLALLCAVFVALGYVQGPKLSSAQVDTTAVTAQPGQQLRLFANQALADVDASQVTVTPPAPVSVTTSADIVAVQFDGLLQYGTEYTVRVDAVRGASASGTGTLEYRFTTASPELTFVAGDQVIRAPLGSDERRVIYTAPGISDIAVVGSAIAVLRQAQDATSILELVSPADGLAEVIPLPGPVVDLEASTVGASVGVVLSDRSLHVADFEVGRDFVGVRDLAGEPLRVTGMRFVPGSTGFVALSIQNTLFAADAAAPGPLLPLGQLTELGRVSQDGTTLTGRDALGPVAVTLADGAQRVLEFQPVSDLPGFVGDTEVLRDGSIIERVALDEGDGSYRTVVAIDDGATARILYDGGGARIPSFDVSPNGQFVALTLEDAQTVIVEIASGAVKQTVPGVLVRW